MATGFTEASYSQPSTCGCNNRVRLRHDLVLVVGCNYVSGIHILLLGPDCCYCCCCRVMLQLCHICYSILGCWRTMTFPAIKYWEANNICWIHSDCRKIWSFTNSVTLVLWTFIMYALFRYSQNWKLYWL